MRDPEHTIQAVEDILGYSFEDRSLLLQALSHKSYINEMGRPLAESNERLEFLGDSVVEIAVTHLLFEDFPDYPEGELTKIRSSLVQGRRLAEVAGELGLGDYILLAKGEEQSGGRDKQSILADAFEAVVGALYLDGGFDVAMGLVISCLEGVIHDIIALGAGDHKSELQELAVSKESTVPAYTLTEEGPDHYKTFYATVKIGERSFGPVPGTSKKDAEQGAARVALLKLGWSEDNDRG